MTQNTGSNNGGKRPSNDSGMELSQVVELGQKAANLLNAQIYNVSHQMCINHCIQQWSATHPKEREAREALWHEVQAHGRAAQSLAAMVERAEQVLQDEQGRQAQSESDYLDRQGFGLDASYQ